MRSAKTIRLSSLGLKVLAAYVAGALFCIALAVAAAVWMVENDVLAGLELRERTGILENKIKFDAGGKPVGLDASDADLDWLYDSLPHETAYRVLDAAGNAVLVSKAGEAFWPPKDSAPPLERADFSFERNGLTLYGATHPFKHQDRQWYLQFATSERLMNLLQRKSALPYLGTGIGIFSALLIVGFGLCAYITLRYALKPLRDISDNASAISPRSLGARLPVEGAPSEIVPLVNSFNHALDRLEKGYRTQQEFLATAAHELKTPLALIRAQIEVKKEGEDRDALLNDVAHMTRQVQQLLILAEVSEVQNYNLTNVDVAEVAHEAASYLQPMADAANVRVIITHAQKANWQADRAALFTLLKNLLENAIQHAPQHTEVRMEICPMVLTVRDWGPGVDQEQLPLLFARFWRGAHRRDHGAGLGLAICQEIARAHGWALSAHRAEPGLCFRLSRPVA